MACAEHSNQSNAKLLFDHDPQNNHMAFSSRYSYFYEAFETQHQYGTTEKDAKRALKYMLLCRIMSNNVCATRAAW